MKNKRPFRPNYPIYFFLLFLSLLIILATYLFQISEKESSLINSIGCGAFSSVIVALLLDVSNCRAKKKNSFLMQRIYYAGLLSRYTSLLQSFMNLIDVTSTQDEKLTWDKWALQFLKNRTVSKCEFIAALIDPLIFEFEQVKKQQLLLLLQHLISYNELVALEAVSNELKCFKSGIEISSFPEFIIEETISKWYSCAEKSDLLKRFNSVEYSSQDELARLIIDMLGGDIIMVQCFYS